MDKQATIKSRYKERGDGRSATTCGPALVEDLRNHRKVVVEICLEVGFTVSHVKKRGILYMRAGGR